MSTKGLIADHRVASVTLNDAGKAATLTLAPGWTFDGQSGPFTLDSVTHGHNIVKGAINPSAPGRAKRTQGPRPQPTDPSLPFDGPPAPPAATLAKITKRSDIEAFIYRTKLVDGDIEVTGWMRTGQPIERPDLNLRVQDMLNSTLVNRGGDRSTAKASAILWTVEMERAARKANDSGCPWPSVFRPGTTPAGEPLAEDNQ